MDRAKGKIKIDSNFHVEYAAKLEGKEWPMEYKSLLHESILEGTWFLLSENATLQVRL